jgi:hypothetical protein
MGRSVLLQLARDSIHEVYEAKRKIEKETLLQTHPLLGETIATTINIYLENELRGSATIEGGTLLENIVLGAKRAVFEDKNFSPIVTSEYLECIVELILHTPNGVMSERDTSLIKEYKAKY